MSRKKFTTIEAAQRLMISMEAAINNMIDEIKKPVDPEVNGSARKAELQSIKQTATDCKELIVERQRLEQMIKDLENNGEIGEAKDYTGGFAERFSK
jgi:translation initiation factor 2B subunit (eIF-2B alpha/beta/delta family)